MSTSATSLGPREATITARNWSFFMGMLDEQRDMIRQFYDAAMKADADCKAIVDSQNDYSRCKNAADFAAEDTHRINRISRLRIMQNFYSVSIIFFFNEYLRYVEKELSTRLLNAIKPLYKDVGLFFAFKVAGDNVRHYQDWIECHDLHGKLEQLNLCEKCGLRCTKCDRKEYERIKKITKLTEANMRKISKVLKMPSLPKGEHVNKQSKYWKFYHNFAFDIIFTIGDGQFDVFEKRIRASLDDMVDKIGIANDAMVIEYRRMLRNR